MNSKHNYIFEGKSFGSFGELLQGKKSNGEDFLVTLPIDLWSVCTLDIKSHEGFLIINCHLPKSRKIVEFIFNRFGINSGYNINVSILRNIPIGKGLSSSTADMLSTLRALEKFFDYKFDTEEISNIFKTIEPHDALMYDTCVFYNQRRGILLDKFDYIPKFKLIAIDFGGQVDTIEYNKNLVIPTNLMYNYNELYQKGINAFRERDDYKIAQCATESLNLYLKNTTDCNRQLIYDNYLTFESIGIINTHSGTCVGLIYPACFDNEQLQIFRNKIEKEYDFSTFIVDLIN